MAEGGEVSKHDCSICLTAFKVPKLLPCFHTFCLQCLDEYVIRNGQNGQFECPLCRATIVLPEGGVKSFQSNFYIQTGSMSDVDVVCDICGDGHNATHYCMECEENFCERCTSSHMKMKMSREHALQQLNGSSDNDGNFTRKVQKKYFCAHHPGEEIKMVCKDCDTLLCVVCKLTEHENHNTSSVRKEAEERRESLSTAISISNRRLNLLKPRIFLTNKRAAESEKKLEVSVTALDKRVESVIADIQKDADTIKHDLLKSNTNIKEHYIGKGKMLRDIVIENQSVINHAQNVLDHGDDFQMTDKVLLSKLQSLALAEECLVKHPDKYLMFEANCPKDRGALIGKTTITSYIAIVNVLGELYCHPDSKKANAVSADAGRLYAAFSDYSKFFCHEIETSSSSFKDTLETIGTCAGLTCIGCHVYFTNTEDKAVYKLDTQEHTKIKFQTFEDYPHGIAYIYGKDHKNEKELLICALKTGNVMALDATEGCIYAISLKDKKQYVWRSKEMPGATCIAVNEADETVCLGYPAARKVNLLSLDGTVLLQFSGAGGPGDAQRFCPVSVCFDSQNCLVIADITNESVIRIDEFGNFLQCIVQGEAPLAVFMGENNILYVGFQDKNITRYSLQFTR